MAENSSKPIPMLTTSVRDLWRGNMHDAVKKKYEEYQVQLIEANTPTGDE